LSAAVFYPENSDSMFRLKKYVLIEIYKLYAAAAGMGSLQLES